MAILPNPYPQKPIIGGPYVPPTTRPIGDYQRIPTPTYPGKSGDVRQDIYKKKRGILKKALPKPMPMPAPMPRPTPVSPQTPIYRYPAKTY
jgi:hypothetical protein